MINRFRDDNRFLSNFFPAEIIFDRIHFPDVEHAFVAAKTLDRELRKKIAKIPTPGKAKRFGRKLALRSDWDAVKEDIMHHLLRLKFNQFTHTDLHTLLLATGDQLLVEGNTWHDRFWGKCFCEEHEGEGKNRLGELLMVVRREERMRV